MRLALKQLGYIDTYHMQSVWENRMDSEMWIEAFEAKYFGKGKPYGREEWDQLLGHCQVKFPTEALSKAPPPPSSSPAPFRLSLLDHTALPPSRKPTR